MSPLPQMDAQRCPQCGAPNSVPAVPPAALLPLATCWRCHAPLPVRQLPALPLHVADPRDRGADPDDRQKEPQ